MNYKDLSGDEVYDFLVKSSIDEVVGGKIIDNKPYRPNEPREIIVLQHKDPSDRIYIRLYNYRELKRGLKSIERYER